MYLELSSRVQGKPLQDLELFFCLASSSLLLQQSAVTLTALNSIFSIPWTHLVLLEMTLHTLQSRRFLHTESQDNHKAQLSYHSPEPPVFKKYLFYIFCPGFQLFIECQGKYIQPHLFHHAPKHESVYSDLIILNLK